jgi:hypothetical protein
MSSYYHEGGFFWHGPEPPMRVPARDWLKNPYEHMPQVAMPGGGCDEECEACKWNRARALKEREDLGLPPKPVELTHLDRVFLALLQVAWDGDNRLQPA